MHFAWIIPICLFLIQPVTAAPTSRETLASFQDHQFQPLVLPDDMRAFIIIMDLNEAQRDIADVRYQSYVASLEDAVEKSLLREQAIRDRLDGILKGRYRSGPGEISSLRVQLVESKASNWPIADTQFNSLVEDIVAIGSPVESETLDRGRFELHRRIYLMPLRMESSDNTYAGEGLDFFELAKAAAKEELKDVPPQAVQESLDGWRKAMQSTIRSYAEAERASEMAERIAILNKDSAARINVMIERSKRWGERQLIDYDTFVSIYGLCPTTDEASMWIARYRQANYPWLWEQDDEVERIATWIIENGKPEQMQIVNEVLPDYLARREELRLEAEALLSEGRRSGANLCDDAAMKYESAQDLIGQLMRNSGQRTVLLKQAKAELEQPLTSGQRSAVARVLLGI
ncbi:MAG: hypothetical protein P8M22_02265 [Phycisphaerales bacterium]|nr:hypothetical protein [Phycisphaerales bacterium]